MSATSLDNRARSSVCVYGAGAVGIALAESFIHAGHDVTVVARNETLAALQRNGLSLRLPSGEVRTHSPDRFTALSALRAPCPHEFLFITVKSQHILEVAETIASSLSPATQVIIAANGVPYWLSYKQPHLESLLTQTDNRDRLLAAIPPSQIIGAMISFNASTVGPGAAQLNGGNRLFVGEIALGNTPLMHNLPSLLAGEVIQIEVAPDLRKVLWHKLLVNISINPASVVYDKPIDELHTNADSRGVIERVMHEVHNLGIRLQVCLPDDFNVPQFLDTFATQRRGAYTSMHQDYHLNRPLELSRIIDVVAYLATLPNVRVPLPETLMLRDKLTSKMEQRLG